MGSRVASGIGAIEASAVLKTHLANRVLEFLTVLQAGSPSSTVSRSRRTMFVRYAINKTGLG
jgi:hypothetical protein